MQKKKKKHSKKSINTYIWKEKILRNVQRIKFTSWQIQKIIIPKKNAQVSSKGIL